MFDLSRYRALEQQFEGLNTGDFALLEGRGPVMVSAPHSVSQWRGGREKVAEPQTGVLAHLLHEKIHCPVIYKTCNRQDDANFDEHSPYKEALVAYVKAKGIRFVLDVHQLAPWRDVMVNIGTGGFRNTRDLQYVNMVLGAFSKRNLGLIQIDTPFGGGYPFTVSSYVAQKCGISCLQLELNSHLVSSQSKEAEQVYDALAESIRLMQRPLSENE